ncbi:myosin regulatory light chain, smooth muscle isoform X5 [Ruditapes philippinarum]|uniref:myosin regulatory light chain, smooth muscle isoform X5 n=1 Tax=Ruditapes philippinarum TaxID=129788 RepID=UPI00295BE616|nr:myosin regulatory light chain, smooth muscle isoform X5 [Ruditapes philippinarum]
MSDDKKAKAATSSVLTKFTQNQIQEMKEAFTMIDQNRDGLIDVSDLKEMYSNLGLSPQDKILQDMVKEAPGQLNFTMFLSLFSEKLSGTDPEETLRQAFQMFDADNTGYIPEEYMKDLLENMGDNFSKDEIRQTWKEAPISGGKVDYNAFVAKIKGKEQEEA